MNGGTPFSRVPRPISANREIYGPDGRKTVQTYIYQPPHIKGGRKRFGPGTARDYRDRPGASLPSKAQVDAQRIARGQKV